MFPFVARTVHRRETSAPSVPGIPLARIGGIQVAIDPSWFLIFVVMVLSLYIQFGTESPAVARLRVWSAAVAATLAFFLSVLAHEFSHSLVARARGITVDGIVLFIFGGVSRLRTEPGRPKDEFLVAVVGPFVSLVLGGLFVLLGAALSPEAGLPRLVIRWLATMNLLLAAFNLLPAFPLDGGRVLRATVWLLSGSLRRATRLATRISAGFAYGIIALGALAALAFGAVLFGLWTAFIGWFLLSAARSSLAESSLREALGRRRVRQAMRPGCPSASPGETIESFVERHVLENGQRCAFVSGDGAAGWVTLREVKRLDRDRWGLTRLEEIMIPLGEATPVAPHDTLLAAFEKMERGALDQLPVVEAGDLVGVVTRDDLLRIAAIDLELDHLRDVP
jgi:Zn-dependent protease